ncbi:diphosphomevalonate/mevalonate 3,5-bisphosphate decarboxylase family protein [Phaeocystidibacter marisrubri]|uniref:Diphosphomevalonate decarboxylase n=1 Tax=Phaeocystidibacter marisrubri TaxID=1577780 RepID=A0A6L3ZHJ6_9FLAO|nr:diphosphomevalonate decarboxylase [Phaeocystidibacter marisrubri]KAB2816955.1 diphosphomevalonate decarboxylase [Phaeocystidibacter marisrubri]GGH77449.1 diphosphomevalonate decarboxylase [Phaeocystidibacter marisrubri]
MSLAHKVAWQSPSNIALVKYWGKKAGQIPANASISFTLDQCHTRTEVRWEQIEATGAPFHFEIYVDGVESPSFRPKIETFFQRTSDLLPFLPSIKMEIHTSNSFPHSSGIASSASGLSALSLCMGSIAKEMGALEEDGFERFCSILSRLGSGSASRSVYGGLVVWGQHESIPGSSNSFGIPYPHHVEHVFTTYRDTVLLVEVGEKAVSSTKGHGLMEGHAFAEARFAQAKSNMDEMISHLQTGDVWGFGELIEAEALSLHAMMMTSRPGYMLFRPNTIQILEKVKSFREENKVPVHFTLDAGANVHLLYPAHVEQKVHTFVTEELTSYCKDGRFIHDQVGEGPKQITE